MAISSSAQSPIRLRKAQLNDVPTLAALGTRVFTVTFGHSVPAEELQAYLQEFYSQEAVKNDAIDPMKDFVVAVDDAEAILGFALLTRGTTEPCIAHVENAIELQRVYVDPMIQGRGVGKMLIERLEEIARKRSFEHIWLGVWEENVKAQQVYKKLGYKMVGDHDFAIGGIVQTDHIMIKAL